MTFQTLLEMLYIQCDRDIILKLYFNLHKLNGWIFNLGQNNIIFTKKNNINLQGSKTTNLHKD